MKGGLTDIVFENKEIISLHDISKSDFAKNNPALISEKIRSLIACPVILKGEVAGILFIDDFKPRQFSERQKQSLNLLADLTGIFIGSSRRENDLKKVVRTAVINKRGDRRQNRRDRGP